MAVKIDLEKCDGCGTCQDNCPTEAIKVVDNKACVNQEECIDCSACQDNCPQQAVKQET
ncbi:MAG: 4Fe-4S binding protein [Tepidisphaeraceae bacterium]